MSRCDPAACVTSVSLKDNPLTSGPESAKAGMLMRCALLVPQRQEVRTLSLPQDECSVYTLGSGHCTSCHNHAHTRTPVPACYVPVPQFMGFKTSTKLESKVPPLCPLTRAPHPITHAMPCHSHAHSHCTVFQTQSMFYCSCATFSSHASCFPYNASRFSTSIFGHTCTCVRYFLHFVHTVVIKVGS